MTLSIEWHRDASTILETHAKSGISEAKEVGRVVGFVQEAARGKWNELRQIDIALTKGKSLREFKAGRVAVIVQVFTPVKLRVVQVGIDISLAGWPNFVANAVAKV